MRRSILKCVFVLAILAGAWALYHKDQIRSPGDLLRLAGQQIQSLRGTDGQLVPWSGSSREVLRLASFNIQVFGPKKSSDPRVMHWLADIVRRFDLVAIQEIRSKDPNLIRRFLKVVNAHGRRYQFVISAPSGRNQHREQSAFLYDSDTVEFQDSHAYSIHDPDDLLRREPFVAWFRAKRPPQDQAFTFSLVNLHLDPSSPELELAHLRQVFRAVRNDGRGEDDVIILGDLNAGDRQLQELSLDQNLAWLISNTPTNTRGSRQYDNIIIEPLSTSEFTGESGVFDFMKQFNLTLAEALTISDHLPVWAEFEVLESGMDQRVASRQSRRH